jgi:hypothetical protein
VGCAALLVAAVLATAFGLPGAARAQTNTPPPAAVPAIPPAAPMQTVPPLQPAPTPRLAPVPALPVQPPTQTGPVPPLQRGPPQITIPLVRPPEPASPAVPAPPDLQRSANEPRPETLTRCNELAGAAAQTECRRRAGVQYRAR